MHDKHKQQSKKEINNNNNNNYNSSNNNKSRFYYYIKRNPTAIKLDFTYQRWKKGHSLS